MAVSYLLMYVRGTRCGKVLYFVYVVLRTLSVHVYMTEVADWVEY